jgi:hypothetical protein
MRTSLFASVSVCALAALGTGEAHACGGLFCSQSMGGQPVDQAGEDIAYLTSPGQTAMIVRILYQGRPESFAWILPVPVVPTAIELGPDALFSQLAPATGPQFQLGQITEGTCRQPSCDFPSGGGCSLGCGAMASRFEPGLRDAGAARLDGGVMVVSEETVGAYETVVLSGGTADETYLWLTDNGYDLPMAAVPLIADYVAARWYFVALRLRGGAGTDAIQPLMLTMAHDQPCLPIRLTAIATVPGLPIRAYFLGAAPFAPTNFSLLDPPMVPAVFTNPTTSPWATAWSDAVDEAGGHAWIRDYAGPPTPVTLTLPSVAFLSTATPQMFFGQAIGIGWPREAIVAIAPRFLELAPGSDVGDFVDRCARFACPETPVRWDPAGLAAALEDEVRAPRQRIQDAFERDPWLTRLYTTLDADEMNLDPEFRPDPGLDGQTNMHVGTLITECDETVFPEGAGQRMEFGDGTTARVREADRELSADDACRMRGATGARSGGCAAIFGRDPATRIGLVAAGVVAALAVRRRRRLS